MPKEIRNPKSDGQRVLDDAASEASAFWTWGDELGGTGMMLCDAPATDGLPQRDLMERAAQFGEAIIRFAKKIPHNPENNRLIDQLVGAGTSIGANYCEADDAVSGKDFKNKIGTCRKESKETMFFLRMVAAAEENLADEARKLWREAKELNLIFGSIWRK
ncbi:MAG: four helix bundle protein [Verrucomicrobia bacterium]|nr:four helix bundle protein [Verrucomicrobiota bacterium]